VCDRCSNARAAAAEAAAAAAEAAAAAAAAGYGDEDDEAVMTGDGDDDGYGDEDYGWESYGMSFALSFAGAGVDYGRSDEYEGNLRLEALMGGSVQFAANDIERAAPLVPGDAEAGCREAMGVCPVCLESAPDLPRLRRASGCGHAFCAPCIERWLDANISCPVCKHDVTEGAGGGRRMVTDERPAVDVSGLDGLTSALGGLSAGVLDAIRGAAEGGGDGFHHTGSALRILLGANWTTGLPNAVADGAAGAGAGA
jgi:hypothetical protein